MTERDDREREVRPMTERDDRERDDTEREDRPMTER